MSAHRVGQVVTACDAWGIPLVPEPVLTGAPRTEEMIVEEEKVARIAYDLGAHIIEVAFPGGERTRQSLRVDAVPGVDIGGTHVTVVPLDSRQGAPSSPARCRTVQVRRAAR